jgi:peptidoglycan lytic transglycosylase G
MKKLFALVLVAALVTGFWVIQGWNAPGPAKHEVTVVVPKGSSLASAATLLQKAGAISSRRRFLVQARLFGGAGVIEAGEYEIPAHASNAQILNLLEGGKALQRMVTIPEGMPSVMVQERLAAAPGLIGEAPLPEEGSVLPNSYSYQRGEARAAVLKRMQAAMTRTLAALWPKRSPDAVVQTPEEALTLASIVEKETAKASERPMVAGVYSNRLKAGMALGADPTVIYPITKGRPLGRRILQSELHAVNGYNTYAKRGLPVGPIANPGMESLVAVLHPAETQALYFVADGTGGHVFANTLAEHNANVKKWFDIRRARGEM